MNNSTAIKITNPKIGLELYQLLISHQVFQDNQKAIAAAFNLLEYLAFKSHQKKIVRIPLHSELIETIFHKYTKGNYQQYIQALRTLGLIFYGDNDYIWSKDKTKKGKCRRYVLSESCLALLATSSKEYLKALHTDKQLMKKTKRSIVKRKVLSKKYNDPVLDYIYDGLININYDFDESQKMLDKSCWSDLQKINVETYLAEFRTKSFSEIIYNETTGRIYHPELNIKSGARPILRYKNQKYVGVLDLRSCYPTFLSSIILKDAQKNNVTITDEMNEEHSKWISIFTSNTIEPKDYIKNKCGYDDTSEAKSAMNESINGGTSYPEFNMWIKTEFPTLFNHWQTMKIKDTGNAIGREYESKLILNPIVFKMADEMDIKLMPEADGYGVFSKDEWASAALKSKLQSIQSYIQQHGAKLFGVPVVIKSKQTPDWSNIDLYGEMEFKRSELEKEYDEWKSLTRKCQRNAFGNHRPEDDKDLKNRYYKMRDKEIPLLSRYAPVIEYWHGYNKRTNNGELTLKEKWAFQNN